MLDELLRLGLVEMTDGDEVRLKVEAFVPQRGMEEKFYYFGRNLADHIAAGVSNLQAESPPFMERAVSYHNLRAADIDTLRALVDELGMDTLKAVNRKAISLRKRSSDKTGAEQRMIFGAYFYSEEQDDSEEEAL